MRKKQPNTNTTLKATKFPLWNHQTFLTLNEAQQRFIYEYWQIPITNRKPWQCYQEAYPGTKKSSCQVGASNLLHNLKIAECIEIIKRQLRNRMGVTTERILKEESFIAFSDIANYFDHDGYLMKHPKDLPARIRKAIAGWDQYTKKDGTVVYKVKLWNKGDSLNRLQNILGMSRQKVEISGPEGGPIQVENKYDFEMLDYEEKAQLKKLLDKCKI